MDGWTFGSRSLGGLVALTEACPGAPALPAPASASAFAGKASQRGARPGQGSRAGQLGRGEGKRGGIALRKVLSLQLHSPGQSVVSSTSTSVDAQDPVNVDWQGCSQSVAEHCITKQHHGLHKHTLGRASSALIKHKTPGNGSTQPQVRAYAGQARASRCCGKITTLDIVGSEILTLTTSTTAARFPTRQLHRQPTQLATMDCGQWWQIGGSGDIQCSHWPAVKRVGSPGCLAVGPLALQAASTAAAVPLHQWLVSYSEESCCLHCSDPGDRPANRAPNGMALGKNSHFVNLPHLVLQEAVSSHDHMGALWLKLWRLDVQLWGVFRNSKRPACIWCERGQ